MSHRFLRPSCASLFTYSGSGTLSTNQGQFLTLHLGRRRAAGRQFSASFPSATIPKWLLRRRPARFEKVQCSHFLETQGAGTPFHHVRCCVILHIDHVTVVVRDVAKAKTFFSLLGFAEEKSVVISGEPFARYMGVDGIEAEHVTLVSKQAAPRFEIQLLRYIRPEHLPDADVENLARPGYNHICFAVTDLEAEVKRLTSQGVSLRNEILDFHARKLVFLSGPEGITVELAEWYP